jgi:hypothetical protein
MNAVSPAWRTKHQSHPEGMGKTGANHAQHEQRHPSAAFMMKARLAVDDITVSPTQGHARRLFQSVAT